MAYLNNLIDLTPSLPKILVCCVRILGLYGQLCLTLSNCKLQYGTIKILRSSEKIEEERKKLQFRIETLS